MEKFFATCPRGLEALLAEELDAAGASETRVVSGGIEFSGDRAVCYRANLHSRIATRILWRIAHGQYAQEEDIYRQVLAQPWERYFPLDCTFLVHTTATQCALRSLEFVTLRTKDAICDRFRGKFNARPSIDTHRPDVRVHLYLTQNTSTLYLDTSGAPLWQRGLRQASVQAPLKENLVAGIIRLSGWQPGQPFLDPMCGSGTFLLEAISMALHRAPGLERRFGFEYLSDFDAPLWQGILKAAQAQALPVTALPIYGSDVDAHAVRATRRNLQEAGLGNVAEVICADLAEIDAPCDVPGTLIANPPYGVRIGEQEALARAYPDWGSTLKKRFPGWTAWFFTADTRLPKGFGLRPGRKTPLFNGPLECRLYEFRMVSGSNRRIREGKDADTVPPDAAAAPVTPDQP